MSEVTYTNGSNLFSVFFESKSLCFDDVKNIMEMGKFFGVSKRERYVNKTEHKRCSSDIATLCELITE